MATFLGTSLASPANCNAAKPFAAGERASFIHFALNGGWFCEHCERIVNLGLDNDSPAQCPRCRKRTAHWHCPLNASLLDQWISEGVTEILMAYRGHWTDLTQLYR